jgi:hypothetical protein
VAGQAVIWMSGFHFTLIGTEGFEEIMKGSKKFEGIQGFSMEE